MATTARLTRMLIGAVLVAVGSGEAINAQLLVSNQLITARDIKETECLAPHQSVRLTARNTPGRGSANGRFGGGRSGRGCRKGGEESAGRILGASVKGGSGGLEVGHPLLPNSMSLSMLGTDVVHPDLSHSCLQGSVIYWTAIVARKAEESVPAIEVKRCQGRQTEL